MMGETFVLWLKCLGSFESNDREQNLQRNCDKCERFGGTVVDDEESAKTRLFFPPKVAAMDGWMDDVYVGMKCILLSFIIVPPKSTKLNSVSGKEWLARVVF